MVTRGHPSAPWQCRWDISAHASAVGPELPTRPANFQAFRLVGRLGLAGSATVVFSGNNQRVLDWDGLEADRVERVVQILLRDEFGAQPIDGVGGDEAQDVRWESPTVW